MYICDHLCTSSLPKLVSICFPHLGRTNASMPGHQPLVFSFRAVQSWVFEDAMV